METWIWRHGHGDMDMKTLTWTHGIKILANSDILWEKNKSENGSPGDFA
jgi:hypothetical protein